MALEIEISELAVGYKGSVDELMIIKTCSVDESITINTAGMQKVDIFDKCDFQLGLEEWIQLDKAVRNLFKQMKQTNEKVT